VHEVRLRQLQRLLRELPLRRLHLRHVQSRQLPVRELRRLVRQLHLRRLHLLHLRPRGLTCANPPEAVNWAAPRRSDPGGGATLAGSTGATGREVSVMATRTLVVVAVTLLATTLAVPAGADPVTPPPAVSGGSNYDYYYLDGCYRQPYQVVDAFNKAPTIIAYQLAGMKHAGQNRLSIGVYHHHGPDDGTAMDSTGGRLPPQGQQNLAGLLADVKQAGFAEIMVVLHPSDGNDPRTWSSWQDALYQENWQLIQSLHPIIAAAGLPFHLDLGGELTASTDQSLVLRYDQQLWQAYTAAFGRADTVGFSINGNDPGQVLNVGKMYGASPPSIVDLHIYDNEYDQFVYNDQQLRQQGLTTQPVIIGEAYYNDKDAASGFAQAARKTGRQIYYLTQWPKTRAGNTECTRVDVAPPTAYAEYAAAGF